MRIIFLWNLVHDDLDVPLPLISPLLISLPSFLPFNYTPHPFLHPTPPPTPLYLIVDKAETLLFSYDVFWEKSDVEWSSRWDAYLLANAPNDKVKGLIFVVLGVIVVVVVIIIIIVVYVTFLSPLLYPF